MKKIFIPQPIHKELMKVLESSFEVITPTKIDKQSLLNEIKECEGMITRTISVDSEMMEHAKKLKVIAKHGIGVDNIDVRTATEKGILLINAPTANIDSVAEHAMAMVLALGKNLVYIDQVVRRGDFNLRYNFLNQEIKGKTLGIIGLGKIGITLAKKMQCLEVDILGYDPFIDSKILQHIPIEIVHSKDEIFKRSDFISLHVPLNESTKFLVGMHEFKLMKKSAFLINASRGQVVNEKELIKALLSKEINGAALDVFSEEPPKKNHPFFSLSNVILSPHNAALTEEAIKKMSTQVVQGIIDFFNNKKPQYSVNPEVLN